jgi:hypothetical protein
MLDDLYCFCNLPTIPEELSQKLIDIANEGLEHNKNIQFAPNTHRLKEFEKVELQSKNALGGYGTVDGTRPVVRYRRTFVTPEIVEWFETNVTKDYAEIGIQTMDCGETFMPHTDGGVRSYILNYLVQTGGDNVILRWYHENDKPLLRNLEPRIQRWTEDNLRNIHEVIFKPGDWTLLNGKVIHSINGVTGLRISLSVAFTHHQFKLFKEKYQLSLH